MSDPRDRRLEETAEAVADAVPLDWEAEEERRPDLGAALRGLRAIERLAAAHRTARLMHEGDDADAIDEDQVLRVEFTWGFLGALEKIGEGSFGEVWRAWDPTLERQVALKLRRLTLAAEGTPPLARTSDPRARHWIDEARRLASIRHPNVLTVYGAAEHDGRAGFWTELVTGETLEDRLTLRGPMTVRDAARIGRDLCAALAAVRSAGLVHGDVKAANVILEPSPDGAAHARPRVVLMDFGAAHHASPGPAPASIGTGTPLVMAPELLAGEAPTPSADIYALGVLLHRLVTGRYPIEAGSIEELRATHDRRDDARFALLRRTAPSRVARAIERALAPRAGDRFGSVEQMARALEPIAEPERTRRAVIVAASILVVAIVGAGVLVTMRRPAMVRWVPVDRLPGPRVSGVLRYAGEASGATPGEQFGSEVVGVGDVNGDGFDDIAVASPTYAGTEYAQGRVSVFLGNRGGRFGRVAWSAQGRGNGDQFGNRVAGAGDVNGDGFADVLVSDVAKRASDHARVGTVFLYLGTPRGLSAEPASRVDGWQPAADFGSALCGVGDVNGDGFGDVAVGALNHTRSALTEGAMFVYAGNRLGLSPRPSWALYGGQHDSALGWLIGRAGDVNGDGYADLLVGEYAWKGGARQAGLVQLYLGGRNGLHATPAWRVQGDQAGANFGYFAGGVGDVNGDGCADFIVTQPWYSGRGVFEGRALLYLGGRGDLSRRPVWTVQGFGSRSILSTAGPGLGDVNGDGMPDILLGSSSYASAAESGQLGVVAVFLSPPDPHDAHPAWYLPGDRPGVPLGWWESSAGDFNGDGIADLVVGQPTYPSDADQRGRAMLFLGQRVPLPR